MVFSVARKGKTVVAHDANGRVMRSHECRSIKCAVALETKLVGDRPFFVRWASDGNDPKALKTKPHGLERQIAER